MMARLSVTNWTRRRAELRHGLRIAAAGVLSFALAEVLALPQAYWAVFTAVLAANDLVAAGAAHALRAAGLRVPDDVSLAGYDNLPTALDLWPNLTTVHVPLEEIGRKAIELAFGPAESRTLVTVPTALVVRESTAAPTPR